MDKISPSEKESKQIWDERDLKFKLAYEQRFKRIETIQFLKSVLFNATAQAFTSNSFESAAYRKFLLLINLVVANAPTDIQIFVQFSHDNVNFFNLMNGPFGSLMYEDSAGNKKECVYGDIIAHWMRLYVLSSGCTSSETFILSIDCEVSG